MQEEKSKVEIITEKLEQEVKAVFESEKFKQYINTMNKFHNYSTRNIILINSQNPEASFVKGYKSWQNDVGHQVQKGEKGIQILAPNMYSLSGESAIRDIENRINKKGEAWLGSYFISKNEKGNFKQSKGTYGDVTRRGEERECEVIGNSGWGKIRYRYW